MGSFSILKKIKNVLKALVEATGSVIMLVLEVCLIIGILHWVFTGQAALFILVLAVTLVWIYVIHEFADMVALIAASIPGGEKFFGIDPNLIRKGDEVRKKRQFFGGGDDNTKK